MALCCLCAFPPSDLSAHVLYRLNRLIAHAKVESVKSKEAAEQRKLKKGGWFSFNWLVDSVASF